MSILVTNRFQTSQYLQQLPDEFKTVQVKLESIPVQVLRRICRDLEKQFGKLQANINYEKEDYTEYLLQLLDEQLMDTKDVSDTLIVLGNKKGMITGKIFNKADFSKDLIDHRQFDDKYPIFIDSSVLNYLDNGEKDLKREREATFSFAPEPKKRETISDLQMALAEQEIEFNKKVDDWKAKYYSAEENNQNLIQAATQNENHLMSQVDGLMQQNEAAHRNQQILNDQVNELKSKIRNMEVANMEEDINNDNEDAIADEINNLRQANEDLKSQMEQMSRQPQSHPAKVMGLFDDMFKEIDSTDMAERTRLEEAEKNKIDPKAEKMSLTQMGIPTWNPNTTSFLDYLISLRSVFYHYNITHERAIHLLLSSLPSKYSYVRNAVPSHPEFTLEDNRYYIIENIVIEMIIGGKDKIFSEFMGLQKKKNENFIHYYQKLVDFYLFTQSDTYTKGKEAMQADPIAFKLIKDKMVKAMPSQLIPEFKRRIEGKDKLPEIFKAILDMRDQFPETDSFENDYSETNLNVLKQRKRPDWHKDVKCFKCGKKGHIKRDCYSKRESKTKKSGISGKNKQSQK